MTTFLGKLNSPFPAFMATGSGIMASFDWPIAGAVRNEKRTKRTDFIAKIYRLDEQIYAIYPKLRVLMILLFLSI